MNIFVTIVNSQQNLDTRKSEYTNLRNKECKYSIYYYYF